MIDIKEVFPIVGIDDNCIINGNGDITFGFSLFLPEALTISTEDYNNLHIDFVRLVKRCPNGTLIHKQDFYYTNKYKKGKSNYDSFTVRANEEFYDQRNVLYHYSNLYITFSSKQLVKVSSKDNSFIRAINYFRSNPYKGIEKKIGKFKSAYNSFYAGLNSIKKIKAKVMGKEQLALALLDFYNLSYSNPQTKIKDQVFQPLEIQDGYMRVGKNFVAVISVVDQGEDLKVYAGAKNTKDGKIKIPDIDLDASFTYPLGIGLPFDHVLNTSIEIIDNDIVFKHLSNSSIGANLLSSLGYAPAKSKLKEIKEFKDAVSDENFQSAILRCNMILHDTTISGLQNKISLVENAFSSMNGARVFAENYDSGNLFFSSIPGNFKSNYRTFLGVVEQGVCYFPKETHYTSDPKGFTYVDRYGKPVVLSMWESSHIKNKNKVLFAPSGGGKSFYLNDFIEQSLAQGNHVIVIDIGGSYKKTCLLNEGIYFDAGVKELLSFNIFLCDQDRQGNYLYKNEDEDGEGADDILNYICGVITMIWKGKSVLEKEKKAFLKDTITDYYDHVNEKKEFPDIKGYFNFLDIFKQGAKKNPDYSFLNIDEIIGSLKLTLKQYAVGEYSFLLNAKENISFKDDRFIVFDLEAISKNNDILDLVLITIMQLSLFKLDKLKGNRTSIFIDEAVDFLKGDMGEFIGGAYRKARKKDGEIILATQGINYLDEIDNLVKKSIFGNSDTKILLNHKNDRDSYPALKQYLSLTDFDLDLLDSMIDGERYREFFIKQGSKSKVLRMEVSHESEAVYTSTATEVREIEMLYKETGNLGQAINQFVENKMKRINQ